MAIGYRQASACGADGGAGPWGADARDRAADEPAHR